MQKRDVSRLSWYRHVLAQGALVCLLVFAILGAGIATGNLAALAQSESTAQTGPSAPDSTPEPPATQIAGWNQALQSIENAIAREGISNEELAELAEQADEIQSEASELASSLEPQVVQLRRQMAELGDPPADGAVESPEIAERRSKLSSDLATVDGLQREARLIVLRVDQLESDLLAKRQQRFFEQLTDRGSGLFSPEIWSGLGPGVTGYLSSLSLQLNDSLHYAIRQARERPLRQVLFLVELIVLIAAFAVGWRWLHRRARMAEAAPGEARLKDWTALGRLQEFGASGILPVLAIAFFWYRLRSSMLLPERFQQLVLVSLESLSLFILLVALLFIFINPWFPTRRIARLSDKAAVKVWRAAMIGLVAISIIQVFIFSATQLLAPDPFVRLLNVLYAAVGLTMALRCLYVVGREVNNDPHISRSGLFSWRNVNALAWLSGIVGIAALVVGFLTLADFALLQIVVLFSVVGLLWLVQRLLEDLKNRLVKGPVEPAAPMGARPQLTVLGFGFARLVAFVLAIIALLVPWGLHSKDLIGLARRSFFGFEIGDLRISVSAMLTALALLLIGILATGQIKQWISSQYLPTTQLDRGLRNSITTIIGYAGVILSAILAVTAAGFDLSSIALVAGALSVGIGLGLQSIVNNFVSGLILLAERPIKSGDWVVTTGGQGTVRKISVRSTEIETFDGATVIVPNSTLITEPVTNWNHRNSTGRITITVGVAYSSDPDQVREILDNCARSHSLVVDHPAHQILFMDYGADALVFELRAYLADIGHNLSVASDLRFSILREFRAAGIEIPFPQRDLHIKTGAVTLAAADEGKPAIRPERRDRDEFPADDGGDGE